MAIHSCQGTGVSKRSISTEFQETVNRVIFSVPNPFARAFPEYIWYFYGRRALSLDSVKNSLDIGSRAEVSQVTRGQNYCLEEYF